MDKKIYGMGTRLRYHIAKEPYRFGYVTYCGEYISSSQASDRKPMFAELCKRCSRSIEKDQEKGE